MSFSIDKSKICVSGFNKSKTTNCNKGKGISFTSRDDFFPMFIITSRIFPGLTGDKKRDGIVSLLKELYRLQYEIYFILSSFDL